MWGAASLLLLACAGPLSGPAGSTGSTGSTGSPEGSPSPVDPLALHRAAIVVDGHSDTTPKFADDSWRFGDRHDTGHMDLPRIREGGLDVQFWSIYMGKREGDGRAIREALERIDAVHQMAGRYPADVAITGSVQEIRDAVAAGKLASVMGVEGGHIIEDNLAVLVERGIRGYVATGRLKHGRRSATREKKPDESGLVASDDALSKSFKISFCLRVRFFGVSTST